MLIVEVDGDCHDVTVSRDLHRDARLRELGWTVIRFAAEDVERDVDSVAQAIVNAAGQSPEFTRRQRTGSGMKKMRGAKKNGQR